MCGDVTSSITCAVFECIRITTAIRWTTYVSPDCSNSRQVGLAPLADVLKKVRDARVVIAGGVSVIDDAALESLVHSSDAHFEVNGRETNESPWQNRVPAPRLVFGSGAPLNAPSEAVSALKTSGPNASNVFRLK